MQIAYSTGMVQFRDCTSELVIWGLEVSRLGQSKPEAFLFKVMPCQISCMATVVQT